MLSDQTRRKLVHRLVVLPVLLVEGLVHDLVVLDGLLLHTLIVLSGLLLHGLVMLCGLVGENALEPTPLTVQLFFNLLDVLLEISTRWHDCGWIFGRARRSDQWAWARWSLAASARVVGCGGQRRRAAAAGGRRWAAATAVSASDVTLSVGDVLSFNI